MAISRIIAYIVLAIIFAALAYLLNILVAALILAAAFVIALGIIWFVLAPSNTLWNFTQEGTAKVVVRGESFIKAFIQWKGHTFDENWNVIDEDTTHKEPWHIGGLRWNGTPLIDTIFSYPLRWRSVKQVEKKEEEIKFHDEILDYVSLKPEVFFTKITAAETKPPERIPLDIEWLVTMRVTNPYKVLFVAPHNGIENALNRINALLTNWTGTKGLDEILEVKKDPNKLWKEIGEYELIKTTLPEWGLQVDMHGIQIRNVDMPEEYQEAAAAEKRQKFEAEGRAAETVGTVLATMAHARGVTVEEIQKEIKASPELQKEFLAFAKDLVTRKIGIEGGSYVDIRVQGAEGVEAMLLDLLAAWQRMPQGKSPKGKQS